MFNIPNNTKSGLSMSGLASGAQITETQQGIVRRPVSSPSNSVSNNTAADMPVSHKGVILTKGQRISLSKMNSALDFVEVGLGWDANSAVYDLDADVFMLNSTNKVPDESWFVFYNQPHSPDGACCHLGDNRNGVGDGDDEKIQIRLSQVTPQITKIAFVITINEAIQRGLNFGGVKNAFVHITDKSTSQELIRFNLTDDYSNVTALTVGELYRNGNEWKFNAVGKGLNTDLAGLCNFYGVAVA